MFCPNCGYKNEDGVKFCAGCGQKMAENAQPAPVNAAPQSAPVYAPPQPAPVYAPPVRTAPPAKAKGPSKGGQILKRLVFALISTALMVVLALLLPKLVPYPAVLKTPGAPVGQLLSRLQTSLLLTAVPIIVAAPLAALLGSAKSSAARQVFAVISVILIAIAFPLPFLFYKANLIPVGSGSTGYALAVVFIFALGLLLRPAVMPRDKKGFGGAFGAVLAALGTGAGVAFIAGFAAILEYALSIPGAGFLMFRSIAMLDVATLSTLLVIVFVLIGLFRAIFDIIAAACGFGFERERFAGTPKGKGKARRVFIVIFAAIFVLVLIFSFVMPLLSGEDPNVVVPADSLLAPGEKGHVLGTDMLGRDLLAQTSYAVRRTLIYSIGSFAIAAVVGIAIGIAAGFTRKAGRTVMEGVIYVLGLMPVFILLILGFVKYPIVPAMALFWGMIAEKTAMLVVSKREDKGVSFGRAAAPLAEELVHTFGRIFFLTTLWTFTGLFVMMPKATLGTLISTGLQYMRRVPLQVTLPLAILFVFLLAAGLLGATLQGSLRDRDGR